MARNKKASAGAWEGQESSWRAAEEHQGLDKLDFLDWDTVLSVGWRTGHLLALSVLLSASSFSSIAVISASKSSSALINHKSLSK